MNNFELLLEQHYIEMYNDMIDAYLLGASL